MILDNSIAFNKSKKYLIIDTETEGLNLIKSRPFQISWCIADYNGIHKIEDRYVYFKDLVISEEVARITKFSWDKYKKLAEPPKDVYKDLEIDLFDKNNIIVGQNILGFDVYIIKTLQKILGKPIDFSYVNRVIDTKLLFVALQKEIKYDPNFSLINWQYKLTSIIEKGLKSSQEHMLKYFEIPYEAEKLHEAKYDIEKLYEIFKKLIFKVELPDNCV